MTLETEVAGLRDELAEVRHELGILQDVKAVRELQFKYGYYMDKCLFPAIVDLFADDAELYFMGGVYHGKAGARRLYGGATGLNGPVDGLLFEHLIVQDIVDVAPDRKTAQGRFRTFMQGGGLGWVSCTPPCMKVRKRPQARVRSAEMSTMSWTIRCSNSKPSTGPFSPVAPP